MSMVVTLPRYTIAELDEFPSDGNRYELLDGMLMVTPSPGSPHQSVATRLAVELAIALQKPGFAHVYAPGAVQFFPFTQLEPDVLVVSSNSPPDAPWVEMTDKWLAVEVFSASSRRYDRDVKREAYIALGVREVWLVDIADKSEDATTGRAYSFVMAADGCLSEANVRGGVV
ncbi:MAG: Uma2 family endonuclease [Gemmatimonadota bacterium]|nr:Uma2 family endonuclease [Gemmatimonadota bacterium]